MKTRFAMTLVSALLAAGTATTTLAAEMGGMPMEGMQKHQGMMGHHPGGMGQQGGKGKPGGMMSCPMMGGGARGGMMGSHMGPTLPPGNEKLQLQMQAEIMQKVGEILAKYAAQVQ